jgi:hypothetical protein
MRWKSSQARAVFLRIFQQIAGGGGAVRRGQHRYGYSQSDRTGAPAVRQRRRGCPHDRQLLPLPVQATGRRPEGCSNEDQPATPFGSEADSVRQSALGELRSVKRNHESAEHGAPFSSRCKLRLDLTASMRTAALTAHAQRGGSGPTLWGRTDLIREARQCRGARQMQPPERGSVREVCPGCCGSGT